MYFVAGTSAAFGLAALATVAFNRDPDSAVEMARDYFVFLGVSMLVNGIFLFWLGLMWPSKGWWKSGFGYGDSPDEPDRL